MSRTSVYEWLHRHPLVVDVVFSGALLIVSSGPLVPNLGSPVALSTLVLTLALTLPLVLRRRFPGAVFAVVCLACFVQVFVTDSPITADAAFLIALYSIAAYERRVWLRFTGLAVGILGAVLATADWSDLVNPNGGMDRRNLVFTFLVMAFLVVVPWVLGDLMRNRRATVSQLHEQNRVLARDRDQRARLAAEEERSRIAREVHDVVAHSLSVIIVQADGGAYAARHVRLESSSEVVTKAAQTLETIAVTARQALTETRRLVGVLREEGQEPELAPQAGIDQLDDLIGRMRRSGMRVSYSLSGTSWEVPREVELAAYRVVQESLTNVLKHAGPEASATVTLDRGREGLRIEVVDDGRGTLAGDDGLGNGLLGMAERVAVYGGVLTAQPRPGGGFGVIAQIPIEEKA